MAAGITLGRTRTALLVIVFLLTPQAHSEVTRLAFPSDSGFDLVWWPNLTAPATWEQDYDASVANAINVLVPSGGSFSDAETIIYARAFFLESPGTPQTLREFIDSDFDSHRSFDPTVRIEESTPVEIADGTSLEAYAFFPEKSGNWEKVAYGEDGQFFLIFVLSSRIHRGFEDALADYAMAVRSYTREPDTDLLEAKHQQSIASDDGKAFEMKAVRAFWGDVAFMRDCVPSDAESPEPMVIYFEVNIDGSLGQMVISPMNEVAHCIVGAVSNRSFPIPPRQWMGKISLEFTE